MNLIKPTINKNLLDLNYNRQLQYLNVTLLIAFAYIIAVAIAIFTKQINIKIISQLSFVLVISLIALIISSVNILGINTKLSSIKKQIKQLDL